MAHAAKKRLPPILQPEPIRLCIKDATFKERIYIIHALRQKKGAECGLGPFTLQQAVCLHIGTTDGISESAQIEMEDFAREEDERLGHDAIRALMPIDMNAFSMPHKHPPPSRCLIVPPGLACMNLKFTH